jgi:hypothetical protein
MYTIYFAPPQYLLDRYEPAGPTTYTINGVLFFIFGDADIKDESLDNIADNGLNHAFQEGNPGLTVAQGRYMWEQEWKPKED